jgi:hypothetical protein
LPFAVFLVAFGVLSQLFAGFGRGQPSGTAEEDTRATIRVGVTAVLRRW